MSPHRSDDNEIEEDRPEGRGGGDAAPINPALAKIAGDVRVLLCLPLLGQLMIMGPAMTAYDRASQAWDQVDALLTVRKERRAQFIEDLKAQGKFHPRGEGGPA